MRAEKEFHLTSFSIEVMVASKLLYDEANKGIRDLVDRLKDRHQPEAILFQAKVLVRNGFLQQGASLRTSFLTDKGKSALKKEFKSGKSQWVFDNVKRLAQDSQENKKSVVA